MSARALLAVALCMVGCVLAQDAISDTCLLTKRGSNGKDIKYDINILSKLQAKVRGKTLAENWVAEELNALDDDDNGRSDFLYYLNVCVGLVNNQLNNVSNGVGAYQKEVGSDRSYIIGTLSDSKLASLRDGDLRYQFGRGEQSAHCIGKPENQAVCGSNNQDGKCLAVCPKRFSEIIMFCSDSGFGEPEFADETSHLTYLFVWNTCAACPVGTPVRDRCDVNPIDECRFIGGNSSLSTGTILVIIVLVLFVTYLTLGVLFNRFVLGARGMEQIPNHEMWVSLCSKIGDGFSYVLQCGRSSTMPARVTPGKGPSVSYEKVTSIDIEEDSSEDDGLADAKSTPSGYN